MVDPLVLSFTQISLLQVTWRIMVTGFIHPRPLLSLPSCLRLALPGLKPILLDPNGIIGMYLTLILLQVLNAGIMQIVQGPAAFSGTTRRI